MKILILSYYFPPMGGVGVQRVLKLLKYIPQHGIEPIVITTSCSIHKIMDYQLNELEYVRGVPVYRIGGDKLKAHLQRKLNGKRTNLKGALFALAKLRHMDIYSTWSLSILPEVIQIVEAEKVDLIYSTSPPHSVHLLAKKIKQVTGVPWIMELRDSLTDWPLRKAGVISYLQSVIESWYEPRLYKASDGVVFVTHYQRKHAIGRCPEAGKKSSEVILNGFDEEEVVSTDINLDPDIFRIVYTGSLIDFEIEGLCKGFELYEKTRRQKEKRIELVIVGPVGVRAQRHLHSLGKSIRVDLVGTVNHVQALDYQQSAHCLLLVQTADYRGKGSEILTGKVFEYIGAKRPILAAVKLGELSELIIQNQFGAVADPFDPESICSAISICVNLANKFSKNSAYTTNRPDKYTRKYQVARTAEFIKSVVEKARL